MSVAAPSRPSARDAGDVELLCALAAAQCLFGRHAAAARLLGLAAWIAPGSPRVHELAALVDLRRGRMDEAHAAAERVRALGHGLHEALTIIDRRVAALARARPDGVLKAVARPDEAA